MNESVRMLEASLIRVAVTSEKAAFDYIHYELMKLDRNGELPFVIDKAGIKQVKKELKILKKIYKGKSYLSPESIYGVYPEDSLEYVYLYLIVALLNQNG